jgi:hypothetical protein
MILKYNENWHNHKDDEDDDFVVYSGEKLEHTLRRAKSFALKNNRVISFSYGNKKYIIDKFTNVENILSQKEYKEDKTPYKIGDIVYVKTEFRQ